MQPWHDFYELLGGAAATLLGLLFVSVSLNADIILGPTHRHSKRLAEQAFQNYLCVLLIALEVIVPGESVAGFGGTVLWTAGIWSLWIVYRVYLVLSLPGPGESRVRTLRRYIPTFLGFAALIGSGIDMSLRHADDTGYIAIATMLLIISATIVAWELLIRVAEEKYAARKD